MFLSVTSSTPTGIQPRSDRNTLPAFRRALRYQGGCVSYLGYHQRLSEQPGPLSPSTSGVCVPQEEVVDDRKNAACSSYDSGFQSHLVSAEPENQLGTTRGSSPSLGHIRRK